MDKSQKLSHTKWECKYHVVFVPKFRRKKLYGELRRHLGTVLRIGNLKEKVEQAAAAAKAAGD